MSLTPRFAHFVHFQESGGAEFTVTIVACGPCPNAGGSLVYAITVAQPVQSWTVVRSHDDFRSLSDALLLSTLPPCPLLSSSDDTGDRNTVVNARNELQGWLSALLNDPGARESRPVKEFLTLGACAQFSLPSAPSPISPTISYSQNCGDVNFDEMQMDDMFFADDENAPAPTAQDDQDEVEDFIPSASDRYKPTDEAVTDEDEMEILQLGDEVEMIDDIVSLAQSLGASHLGRSLQLQAEMKYFDNKNYNNDRLQQPGLSKPQQGLNIEGFCTQLSPAVGGIGSALEHAANKAHFNHQPPVSAPRLDSFKLIRVIGKGKFGTYQ
jgi:PX domain